MAQNNYTTSDPLSLDAIRNTLVRLEDTIIFSLIERAQFALNPAIYQRNAFAALREIGFEGSWLEWFLKEIESFHAKARRYTSPDEYPFTSSLPPPLIPPLAFPPLLHPNTINVNATILHFYIHSVVPRITLGSTQALAAVRRAAGKQGAEEWEDDGNYGSAATVDVAVLQALSKRVHYGKFVSESKFRSSPASFIPHIHSRNREALDALITNAAVERALLVRLGKKARLYGQEIGPDGEPVQLATNGDAKGSGESKGRWRIEVDTVVQLYESWIIPLTKEVEVDYLLQRLDGLSEQEIEELKSRPCKKS